MLNSALIVVKRQVNNMKKITLRYILIISIGLVLFNILFFVIPYGDRNALHWVTYGVVTFAILSQLVFYRYSINGNDKKLSLLYGYPIYKLGFVFLGIVLLMAVLFIGLNVAFPIKPWVAIVFYALAIGLGAVSLIAKITAKDVIEEIDNSDQKSKTFKKEFHGVLHELSLNKELKNNSKLISIIEELKYSDPIGNKNTVEIEESIIKKTLKIKDLTHDDFNEEKGNELLIDIHDSLLRRNELCKINK